MFLTKHLQICKKIIFNPHALKQYISIMANVVLLFGGNEDKTEKAFEEALILIKPLTGEVNSFSSLYESEPWGFDHPSRFLNQVIKITTSLDPLTLLTQTQAIEKQLGRQPKTTTGYEARLIDIDILFSDNLILNHPRLQIPHPRLHLRRFTLVPLCEIMPHFVHPILKKDMRALLRDCPDTSNVSIANQSFGP